MNKLSKNEEGFSAIAVVIVIIILIGVIGYFVYKNNTQTSTQNIKYAKCPAGYNPQYSVSPNEPNNWFCAKDGEYITT